MSARTKKQATASMAGGEQSIIDSGLQLANRALPRSLQIHAIAFLPPSSLEKLLLSSKGLHDATLAMLRQARSVALSSSAGGSILDLCIMRECRMLQRIAVHHRDRAQEFVTPMAVTAAGALYHLPALMRKHQATLESIDAQVPFQLAQELLDYPKIKRISIFLPTTTEDAVMSAVFGSTMMPAWRRCAAKLESLMIEGVDAERTGRGLADLFTESDFPHLRQLHLVFSHSFPSYDFPLLLDATRTPCLTDFKWRWGIRSATIANGLAAQICRLPLTALDLELNCALHDKVVMTLPELVRLHLVAASLPSRLDAPRLRDLSLSFYTTSSTPKHEAQAVSDLIRRSPELESISMEYCCGWMGWSERKFLAALYSWVPAIQSPTASPIAAPMADDLSSTEQPKEHARALELRRGPRRLHRLRLVATIVSSGFLRSLATTCHEMQELRLTVHEPSGADVLQALRGMPLLTSLHLHAVTAQVTDRSALPPSKSSSNAGDALADKFFKPLQLVRLTTHEVRVNLDCERLQELRAALANVYAADGIALMLNRHLALPGRWQT